MYTRLKLTKKPPWYCRKSGVNAGKAENAKRELTSGFVLHGVLYHLEFSST
jgi:hypothetical protein